MIACENGLHVALLACGEATGCYGNMLPSSVDLAVDATSEDGEWGCTRGTYRAGRLSVLATSSSTPSLGVNSGVPVVTESSRDMDVLQELFRRLVRLGGESMSCRRRRLLGAFSSRPPCFSGGV